jgi:hypothetical protein
LSAQSSLVHSLFDGPRFRKTLFDVSTSAVLANSKLRAALFHAYIEQIKRYVSRQNCVVVDELVAQGEVIGLRVEAAEFQFAPSCDSISRLFAIAPP